MGRLSEAYQSALNDPTLLDLEEPLSALSSMIERAAERANNLDTPDFRMKALELFDAGEMPLLGELLNQGVSEDEAFRELRYSVESFAKRAEAAWDKKLQKQHAINSKDLVEILGKFVAIVTEEVAKADADRVLARIDAEVLREVMVSN